MANKKDRVQPKTQSAQPSQPNKASESQGVHAATYGEVQKMHALYFNIVKKRYWYFAISLLILIPGIISLIVQGLNLGIEFTGGSMLEMTFNQAVSQTAITDTLQSVGLEGQVQLSNNDTLALIRTSALEEDARNQLLSALQEKVGAYDQASLQETKIGPAMGDELKTNAIKALSIACLLMLGYITVRFKFDYAISAVISLLHDVFIVLGIFSLFQIEIDATFVAAILTIFGYSINDTVVIFDRIRENESKMKRGEDYEDVVDKSIWQTMSRSINTTVSVLIALLSIFVFGGESTKVFSLAMLIGVGIGAYSTIFNASQILVEIRKRFNPKGRKPVKA